MTYRIVVADSKAIDSATLETAFDDLDATIEKTDASAPEALIEVATGADALLVDASARVTEGVLETLDSLAVVGRAGIGVDNVALEAAADRSVTVVNVPGYAVDEVATHALGLLLSCLRQIPTYDREVRDGEWAWKADRTIERLAGQTVGLVAFGKIARNLARKLEGFDVDVLTYDPYIDEVDLAGHDVRRVGFEELLSGSDAVSIHAPLTDETRGMFDADAFAAMREGAILVNTGRGGLIDEDALYDALVSGTLRAAGLDVRGNEPPESSRLAQLDSVVSTPHVAWYSEASRRDLTRTIATDVTGILRGEEPIHPVTPESPWY